LCDCLAMINVLSAASLLNKNTTKCFPEKVSLQRALPCSSSDNPTDSTSLL